MSRERVIKAPVQKRSRATHQKILNAAREMIAEVGFDALTANMIAERAGVAVGSLYAHFANKQQIFLTILDEHAGNVYAYTRQSLHQIMEQGESLEEAIDWLIPGLYAANKLYGQLNVELARFVLVDRDAAEIHKHWEDKEDEEILAFLMHFAERAKGHDIKTAAMIVHLSIREVFRHLFQNSLDEDQVLGEFQQMLKNMIK